MTSQETPKTQGLWKPEKVESYCGYLGIPHYDKHGDFRFVIATDIYGQPLPAGEKLHISPPGWSSHKSKQTNR